MTASEKTRKSWVSNALAIQEKRITAFDFEQAKAQVLAASNGRIALAEPLMAGNSKSILARCQCGLEFRKPLADLRRGVAACPACSKGRSGQERNLEAFVRGLGFATNASVRKVRTEFDVVVPDKALAIEFHGLAWHSERTGKSKIAHATKRVVARAHGLRLIQIFSDEWEQRRVAVELLIRDALGVLPVVGARQCRLVRPEQEVARAFIERHHVQGAPSSVLAAYGLKREDELVAVMLFSSCQTKRGGTCTGDYELARYASLVAVPGGPMRLLRAFMKDYEPAHILSHVDHRYSDGDIFPQLGFVQRGKAVIDYEYLFQRRRWHKSSFKKRRMRERFGDVFPADWTESQMADHVGAWKVWNAGRTTWVWGSADVLPNMLDQDLPMLDEARILRAHQQRLMATRKKLSATSKARWADPEFKARMVAAHAHPDNVARIRDKQRQGRERWWWHAEHGLLWGWHSDLLKTHGGAFGSWCDVFNGTAKHVKGWHMVGEVREQAEAQVKILALEQAKMGSRAQAAATRAVRVKERAERAQRREVEEADKKTRIDARKAIAKQRSEAAAQARHDRAKKVASVAPGMRFARLTVLESAAPKPMPSGQLQKQWRVRCDCGTEKAIAHSSLQSGLSKSCGCLKREAATRNLESTRGKPSPTKLELTGLRFGMLTVLGLDVARTTRTGTYWRCRCDCGKEHIVKGAMLRFGAVKSCGCLRGKRTGLPIG